jgi:hypothetical protein
MRRRPEVAPHRSAAASLALVLLLLLLLPLAVAAAEGDGPRLDNQKLLGLVFGQEGDKEGSDLPFGERGVSICILRHTSHVTRHTSHGTRHTSHVTRHTSHVTRHTSRLASRQVLSEVAIKLASAGVPTLRTLFLFLFARSTGKRFAGEWSKALAARAQLMSLKEVCRVTCDV